MPSNLFGTLLNDARRRTRNPETQKSLTQQGLADAIATILKTNGSPTFQTISYWERGTHQPESKDRDMLLALVAALVHYQGLLTRQMVNELLQGGGYAQLSDSECVKLNLADPAERSALPTVGLSHNQTITGGTTGVAVVGDIYGGVAVHMPASLPPTAPRQLRAPTTDFVGRTNEIKNLIAALGKASASGSAAAISGVRGMGGIGKSELALVVAAQLGEIFPYQIELDLRGSQGDSAVSSVQALQSVINAFGSTEKLPDDERELVALYRSTLSGKRVLIFADDAKDAAQVRPLMPPPGSALLMTSRLRFRLPGMFDVDLEGLSDQEAVDLLHKTCLLTSEQAGFVQ